MVAETQLITARDFSLLPEQRAPIELIGGEIIVSPGPTPEHQNIITELRDFLETITRERGLGRWYQSPLDLFVTSYDVFQPDMMLFPPEQLPGMRELPIEKIPLIVVEVLSPSNRGNDLIKKLPKYASRGIAEYWIVDPANQSIAINVLDVHGNYRAVPVGLGPIQVGVFAGVILPVVAIFNY